MKKLIMITALFAVLVGCSNTKHAESQVNVTPVAEDRADFFDQVTLKMPDEKVKSLIGSPDRVNSYTTGKQWIPFYFGSDTHRVDWFYSKVGYITFSRNRYTGTLSVTKKVYDGSIE